MMLKTHLQIILAIFIIFNLGACQNGNSVSETTPTPENVHATAAVVTPTIVNNGTGKLNDTGITWGANFPSGNNLECIGESIGEQDCSQGRDIIHPPCLEHFRRATCSDEPDSNLTGQGHAGFSFTKLGNDGSEINVTQTQWSCVQDSVTGLIWEVKQGGNAVIGDEGLHDADDRYTWYSTDVTRNGGLIDHADDDGNVCFAYTPGNESSYCNLQAYVARVNREKLCGATDWRVPSRQELLSLVDYSQTQPAINTQYFPSTKSTPYWTATPSVRQNTAAWSVLFYTGAFYNDHRANSRQLRLVRAVGTP